MVCDLPCQLHASEDRPSERGSTTAPSGRASAEGERMRTIGHKSRVTLTIRLAIVMLAVCWGQAAMSKSSASSATAPQNVAAKPPLNPADYIGEARCIECHGQENKHFTETLHAKAFRLNPKDDR